MDEGNSDRNTEFMVDCSARDSVLDDEIMENEILNEKCRTNLRTQIYVEVKHIPNVDFIVLDN